MTTTFTPFDVIETELYRRGYDEFSAQDIRYGKNFKQLAWGDTKPSILAKVLSYDDDVANVVTSKLFAGFSLQNKDLDKFFKKMFVQTFSHREIKYQTLERWQGALISQIMRRQHALDSLFTNLDKYLSGELTSTSEITGKDGNNFATQDLPQDSVTADLESNLLEYANSNNLTRGFNNSNSVTSSKQFTSQTLFQFYRFWGTMLDELDTALFLQIW